MTRQALKLARDEVRARVFKNYSFLASSYVVSRLLTFLTLVYLARRIGVEFFGQVNFAYAIFMYSTLLTHLGLMTFGTRAVARSPMEIRLHVSNILPLRMALTSGSFLLLLSFVYLVRLEPQAKQLIILFALSLFPTALLMDWPFKGVERMNVVGLIEIVRAVPYLALVLLFVNAPSQVLRVPVFFLVSTGLAAVLGLGLFWRDYGIFRLHVRVDSWIDALRQSLPLGLGFMMLQAFYLTDMVVLGFLATDASVGLYSAAYRIVSFVLVLGGLFFESTFPAVARYYHHDSKRVPQFINSSLRATALLVVPMAVGGTLLARPMLASLYGAHYDAAGIAFQLLVWAVAIELIGMNWVYALMACDHAKDYMRAVGLGALVSVALNLALIPLLGLIGAGVTRLVCSIIISTYFCIRFRSIAHVKYLRYLTKPALASALMAGAMLITGNSWILRIAVGCAVYGGAIFIVGSSERKVALEVVNALLNRTSSNTVDGRPCSVEVVET
jgi:O-antigen/teichoic acid export membrane protein